MHPNHKPQHFLYTSVLFFFSNELKAINQRWWSGYNKDQSRICLWPNFSLGLVPAPSPTSTSPETIAGIVKLPFDCCSTLFTERNIHKLTNIIKNKGKRRYKKNEHSWREELESCLSLLPFVQAVRPGSTRGLTCQLSEALSEKQYLVNICKCI